MISLPDALSDYQILHPIGFGTYSTVYCAVHLPSNINVAIKIIPKNSKRNTNFESRILQRLCHPFIPKIYEYTQDDQNNYIVMEFAEGGNLLQYINLHGPLSVQSIRVLARQLFSIIKFLGNIIHRDIKTENILLDRGNNIRLADFGLAVESNGLDLTSPAGSPQYVAPEIIRGQNYGKPADIWSVGVVLYCCAFGYFPFFSSNKELKHGTLFSILTDELIFPKTIDPDLEDLITKALKKDQKERITIDEMIQHPFLNDVIKKFPLFELDDSRNSDVGINSQSRNVTEKIIRWNREIDETLFPGIIDQNPIANVETDEHKSTVEKVQKNLTMKTKDPMEFLAKKIISKGAPKKRNFV
ncbi:CAMK family protein kinase [Tritrichomonas foetus]|uniref:CAMK family protein kinase n=1 Tax=Tritrichomonas foetus TaxID=1144522 RepID=A0A1J4K6M0_9EUKA|nr:CAMK family protein kinase [Tritrichomonas foetus]|eukprot:OHT06618.1 CAMK family protein kinase [Tritrichomonas foetus]